MRIQNTLPDANGFVNEIGLASLVGLLLAAVWFDIRARRIPNWLVLLGLAISFCLQFFLNNTGLIAWALGLLLGFGLLFPSYLVRAMGAGDVKLLAMVGSFVGPETILGIGLTTFLVGGIFAILVALYKGLLKHTITNVRLIAIHIILNSLQRKTTEVIALETTSLGNVPYAVAIAAGTLIYLSVDRVGYALIK